MLRRLLVGRLIALPCGAGVALSILGGYVGSLVGVAISSSLLVPAVNTVSKISAGSCTIQTHIHAFGLYLINGTHDYRIKIS